MVTNRLIDVPRNNEVLAVVKSPGMMRPSTVSLPASTTVADSLETILRLSVTTDDERRNAEHLRREIDGPHHFFALTPQNSMREVKPKTTLNEIAVPRQLQFADGPKEVSCAAIEVVQYASVGAHGVIEVSYGGI